MDLWPTPHENHGFWMVLGEMNENHKFFLGVPNFQIVREIHLAIFSEHLASHLS